MTARSCDTSVLIPAIATWHPDHVVARDAIDDVEGVPAHVLVECYSVLTRLPAPQRWSAAAAAELIAGLRLDALSLPGDLHQPLIAELARHGVRGGATYDGLVAATAKHHDLHLVTRDRRACPTYDAVGVTYTML